MANDDRYLTDEELRILRDNYNEESQKRASEDVVRLSQSIHTIQLQFRNRIDNLDREKQSMSNKELLIWERDYSEMWHELSEIVFKTKDLHSHAAEAQAEYIFFGDIALRENMNKLIEAQSGRFFKERIEALRTSIISGTSKAKDEELALIEAFPKLVNEHFDLHSIEPSPEESESWDKQCTTVHNNLIETLNKINILCREYGLMLLTPRNFWSTTNIKTKEDQASLSRSEKDRYFLDRRTVVAYYNVAFQITLSY